MKDTEEDAPRNTAETGPLGQGDHEVREGDCMTSIATEHGFFWKTLWNLAENSDLKSARKDPFCLLSGDRVHVPPLRKKQETRPCKAKHRFRRKGVPARLKLKVLDFTGQPRKNEEYVLVIDGDSRNGKLDSNGVLDVPISPMARGGKLRVGDDVYLLALGNTDPVTETTGIQQRLNNLKYHCGFADGTLNPLTVAAIEQFQGDNGLEVTGEPDEATRNKLHEVHGS
jgi:N-acetylmuramoyl-L-alanine amidase